jgi:hypothetical protein
VQVLFLAVLVNALHAALEHRVVVFNGVAVDVSAHIFVLLMCDRAVLSKLFSDGAIVVRLVSHEAAFAADILANDRHDVRDGNDRQCGRNNITGPLSCPDASGVNFLNRPSHIAR